MHEHMKSLTNPITLNPDDIKKFWERVNKDGPTMPHMNTKCWTWSAYIANHGYGVFCVGMKQFLAHRVSWTITNGAIPHDGSYHGICVCHHCDNPLCCNPSHFFLGTNAQNMADREVKGRNGVYTRPDRVARGDRHGSKSKPECVPRGDLHQNSKLTARGVIEARSIYQRGGVSLKNLAPRFGVDPSVLGRAIRHDTWKHIKCALPNPENATSATKHNTLNENELSKGQSHEENSSR